MAHPPENSHPPEPGNPPPEMRPESGTAQNGGLRKSLIVASLIVLILIVLAIAAALRFRIHAENNLKQDSRESAVLPVSVVHPTPLATTEEITLPGNAQAFRDTPIYARTSGYLKAWKVDIGTRVKQGQVLAEIETPEVDQQLGQAQADLKNAEANLDLAQITATRAEGLFKKTTISAQERDQAQSDLAAKRALVDSGKANVGRLEQLKAFEQVVAPFDGVITARNTDIGSLIQAGENTTTKELFHLADNHILRVYFSVPEIYASIVKAGEKTPVTFDSFPGEKFEGDIVRDAAALDPRSHTLMVEADVENPDGRLFPGAYATVHLKLPPASGTVTIPANTLLFRAEGTRVAIARDNHVSLVAVNIVRDHGNSVEVLGGITPQDSVILDPSDSLADGATVRIVTAPESKPAAK